MAARDQAAAAEDDEPSVMVVDSAKLQIFGVIGDGGTSSVRQGYLDGRYVAVKDYTWPEESFGVVEQRCFDRELRALSKINHPNIIQLQGVALGTLRPRVLLELCWGGCLFQLLHHSADVEISLPQRKKIALDTASAVEYLHALSPPLLHRDLKSPNLLLAQPVRGPLDEVVVKLADFGLCRALPEPEEPTEVPAAETSSVRCQAPVSGQAPMTMAAGTAQWRAPEVFISGDYGAKADVYSFAMVLYEIFARVVPFADLEANEVLLQVLRGVRPELSALMEECPDSCKTLIVACWAQQSRRRPSFSMIRSILQMQEESLLAFGS